MEAGRPLRLACRPVVEAAPSRSHPMRAALSSHESGAFRRGREGKEGERGGSTLPWQRDPLRVPSNRILLAYFIVPYTQQPKHTQTVCHVRRQRKGSHRERGCASAPPGPHPTSRLTRYARTLRTSKM